MSFDTAYAAVGGVYANTSGAPGEFTGAVVSTHGPLYDFLFREQTATEGRWLTPDPAGMAAVDPTNPQSWNRYAYVVNSPLGLIDLLGLVCSMSWGTPENGGLNILLCGPSSGNSAGGESSVGNTPTC